MALQHLRSGVANKRPIPTIMSEGQIALNTNEASPGLFFKDSNGDLVKIGPVHIGTSAPNSSPASTAATALVTGATYQILTVGTSDFTAVGASANTVGTIFTATGTTTGTGTVSGQQGNEKGEQWLDTSLTPNELKVYNGTAWVSATGQEIPVSKLANGTAYQLLQTDSAGTGVEWTSNIDVPGTLDVTSATTLDSTLDVAGLLSADGRIQLPAGAESTPSLSFGTDAATGTGMYFPGSGDIAFTLAGTGRVFIKGPSGRVGFNEDAPDENLVIGSISGDSIIHLKCSPTSGKNASVLFGSGKQGAIGYVEGSANDFFIFETNSTEQIRLSNKGQVLVGDSEAHEDDEVVLIKNKQSSATNTLVTIEAPSTSGKSVLNFGDTSNHRVGRIEYTHNDNALAFFTQATASTGEQMRIDSSGRLLIGTTTTGGASTYYDDLVISNTGSGTGCGITLLANATNGFNSIDFGDTDSASRGRLTYSHADDSLRIDTAGTEQMRIDSSGNVGIGTTPAANRKVHIQGTGFTELLVEKSDATTAAIMLAVDAGVGSIYTRSTESNSTAIPLTFHTGNDEQMRIDSSGRLGVGTTSPNAPIEIQSATGNFTATYNDFNGVSLFVSNDGTTGDGNTSGAIAFDSPDRSGSKHAAIVPVQTGADSNQVGLTFWVHPSTTRQTDLSEAMRIDSSGRLLVGTSSFTGEASAVLEGSSAGGTTQAQLWLNRGQTNPTTDNVLGQIIFGDATASGRNGAMIQARVDSSWGSGDYPSRLGFFTTADNASSPTERMRISSNGDFKYTLDDYNAEFFIHSTSTTAGALVALIRAGTTNTSDTTTDLIRFQRNDGTEIGKIRRGGFSSVAYDTSSDYRIKANIVPLAGAIERVKQFNPVRFNWIEDTSDNPTVVDGFLAHEAQTVVPEAVSGYKDEVDDDGNPVIQGIDQSKLVPLLTAALQEAITEIEGLKQRLTDAGL